MLFQSSRKGQKVLNDDTVDVDPRFQSARPRRAGRFPPNTVPSASSISIRPPTKGGTPSIMSRISCTSFQSARPRRAGRRLLCRGFRVHHFNPPAHEGRDFFGAITRALLMQFQSARPRRAGRCNILLIIGSFTFQSARPRRAGLYRAGRSDTYILFQSARPRRAGRRRHP